MFISEQINRTRAKSQQIVAQRLLSCLQYPVLYLSRLQRICLSQYLKLQFSIRLHRQHLSGSASASQFYDLGCPEDIYRYSW